MTDLSCPLYPEPGASTAVSSGAARAAEWVTEAVLSVVEAVDRHVQTETRRPDAAAAWEKHGVMILSAVLRAKGAADPDGVARMAFGRLCVACEYVPATPEMVAAEVADIAAERGDAALVRAMVDARGSVGPASPGL